MGVKAWARIADDAPELVPLVPHQISVKEADRVSRTEGAERVKELKRVARRIRRKREQM